MPSLRDGDARARPPRPLVGAPCGPLLVAEGALCFWRLLPAGATLVALPAALPKDRMAVNTSRSRERMGSV